MNYAKSIKNDYKDLYQSSVRPGGKGYMRTTVSVTLVLAILVGIALSVISTLADASREPAAGEPIADTGPEAREPRVIQLSLPNQQQDDETTAGASRTVAIALPKITPETRVEAPAPQADSGADTPAEPEIAPAVTELDIRSGDTLSALFSRAGIEQRELFNMLTDKSVKQALKGNLQPGQQMRFTTSPDGKLQTLVWQTDRISTIDVSLVDDAWQVEKHVEQLESRIVSVSGDIDSSLFIAGQKAGLPDRLIMQMVGILGWDIDFALDIREGDSFNVLYEELYNDQGEKIADGDILAAGFTNRGRDVVALRYTDPDGHSDYYSPDGRSMRKAFLRTPVKFSRISSRFSTGRKHPILNRIRSHKGVDYAAPTGTPVKASGDGKVIFRGRKGGWGRTVIIQHGGKYTTLYAHLSRYNGKARQGSRVKQGQTIGYVGQSGLATGPHLHYEFRINGVHRNPLTVKLPKAEPLNKKHMDDFRTKTGSLLAQLQLMQRTQLALNQ